MNGKYYTKLERVTVMLVRKCKHPYTVVTVVDDKDSEKRRFMFRCAECGDRIDSEIAKQLLRCMKSYNNEAATPGVSCTDGWYTCNESVMRIALKESLDMPVIILPEEEDV